MLHLIFYSMICMIRDSVGLETYSNASQWIFISWVITSKLRKLKLINSTQHTDFPKKYCKRVLKCVYKSVFQIFNSYVIVRMTLKPNCWVISHTVIEIRGRSSQEVNFLKINSNLTVLEEVRFTDATYWLIYTLNFHCV